MRRREIDTVARRRFGTDRHQSRDPGMMQSARAVVMA